MGVTCSKHLDKIRDMAVQELKEHCLKVAGGSERNNNSPSVSPSAEGQDKEEEESTSAAAESSAKGLRRFSDLLLRLSPLRSLQPDVLEELFFPGLIGKVNIDSVVPYILKMKAVEYNSSPFSATNAGERAFYAQTLKVLKQRDPIKSNLIPL